MFYQTFFCALFKISLNILIELRIAFRLIGFAQYKLRRKFFLLSLYNRSLKK